MNYFSNVSLLITHYNRSGSLERLLSELKKRECIFDEVIVSDDGSDPTHKESLLNLQYKFDFKFLTSDENRGLGHNLNKGQNAAACKYTLYIQEDFIPTDKFPESLKNAVSLIETDEKIDIIRFYAYAAYPYLKKFKFGFSEMIIKPFHLNYKKIYMYSDHPHLRRSCFLKKFGDYEEGIPGDRTEYRMCLSFIQRKGKGLFYNNYKELFIQENSSSEPSTMSRNSLTNSKNFFIATIRFVYRQVKYNYDINFYKKK